MARRIRVVALVAAAVAIALFALPLAIAVQRLYLSDETGELERAALRAAVSVDPGFDTGRPAQLPKVEAGTVTAVYDTTGRRVSGTGPATADSPTARALNGQIGQAQRSGELVAAVPISAGEQVIGAVRASSSSSTVWQRTLLTWAAMFLLALLALFGSVLVARAQARRISQPLERLAAAAQVLGEGDFAVRTEPTGMPEVDRAGAALNSTAERLHALVARERAFASNASHQLRTPLSGLRLRLESALAAPEADLPAAAAAAIDSADQLERTIEDLLVLAREPHRASATPVDLARLLEGVRERWHGPLAAQGRRLAVHIEPRVPPTDVSERAVRQVLDVLLDNAFSHANGTVTVTAREASGAAAIDVADEGPGVGSTADELLKENGGHHAGHGIGLALARDLLEAQDGRLLLAEATHRAVFTVLLPARADCT